jgi:hypothetical protein
MGQRCIYQDKKGDRVLLCIDTGFGAKRFTNRNNIALTSIPNHIITPSGRLEHYFFDSIDEQDGEMRFTGKYLPGKTLGDRVAGNPDQSFGFLSAFLRAIKFSSGSGLSLGLHLPHLIWVLDDGSILLLSVPLLNFCASRSFESKTEILQFNHPQLEGEHSAIFSACTMAYRALTGNFPYQGGNEIDLRQKMLSADPLPARHYRPELTEEAELVLKKGLDQLEQNPPMLTECENLFTLWATNPPLSEISDAQRAEIQRSRKAQVQKTENIFAANDFLKKNKKRLLVGILSVTFICFIAIPILLNVFRERMTVGLPAIEVINLYYESANKLDIQLMADCLKDKKVSSFYQETENSRFQFIMPNSKFISVPQWYEESQRPLFMREWLYGDRVISIEEKSPNSFEVIYEKWIAVGLETGRTGIDEALLVKERVKIEDFGKYKAITEITILSKEPIDVSALNLST